MRKAASEKRAGAGEASFQGSFGQAHGTRRGRQIHLMKIEQNDRFAIAEGQGKHSPSDRFVARFFLESIVLLGGDGGFRDASSIGKLTVGKRLSSERKTLAARAKSHVEKLDSWRHWARPRQARRKAS